jgi:uncharacterized protein YndB with AHSA1/START domain
MGFTAAADTTINAPSDRVFAYLSDFGRHQEWAEPKHEQRIQPPAQSRPGATFTSVGKDMGGPARNSVTIRELVPGERIVYVAEQDDGTTWRNTITLAPVATGTRVTKGVELLAAKRFPKNVIIAILAPFMKGEVAKLYAGDLARIKSRLESAATLEVAS